MLSERKRLRTESIEEHITPNSAPAQWPGNKAPAFPATDIFGRWIEFDSIAIRRNKKDNFAIRLALHFCRNTLKNSFSEIETKLDGEIGYV